MNDELLPYYNRELAFLRRLGAEFAEAHPKIAGRLRLGPDTVEDPHVSRLVESVAFLNARIRRKLDDEFPELTDALLGNLYPHLLAPVPSMSIVQFECDPELTGSFRIDAGTALETDPIHGEPCRFRTCYPVTTWPVAVSAARLAAKAQTPTTPRSTSSASVLRIQLDTRAEGIAFGELAPDALRFFLRGQPQEVFPLYELIFNDTIELCVATGTDDPDPCVLPRSALRPVGFETDEGLLPYSKRSHLAYRLLTEYFVFPAKFLFLEIGDLPAHKLEEAGEHLELYLFMRRSVEDLEQTVTAETFALGCTPIVNLFARRAEPIRLTHTTAEYRVVPDARRPLAAEIYSVDAVTSTSPTGDRAQLLPFYGLDHRGAADQGFAWWVPVRRPASDTASKEDHGSEVFLQLVDLDLDPSEPPDGVVSVETTCLNRDLPGRLPFGGDQPRLQFGEGGGPIQSIRCLTAPTPTVRPPLARRGAWRLVSHLTLNHLSLSGGDEAVRSLREILRLHDLTGAPENADVIDGVLSLNTRLTAQRILSGGLPGICPGTEVEIQLDESRFAGSGVYLFAAVLERFLGRYAAVNSFVRLVVRTKDRQGELCRWPARAGDRVLL